MGEVFAIFHIHRNRNFLDFSGGAMEKYIGW